MFHYTFFGHSSAQMRPRGFCAATVFGVTELKRPTLAQRVVMLPDDEAEPAETGRIWERITNPKDVFLLTVFGRTEISEPTLMEEYAALRSLVTTGALPRDEVSRRLRRLIAIGPRELTTLTIFSHYSDVAPKRSQQLKALQEGENAGLIRSDHRRRLDAVVDGAPGMGIEVLGDLVAEMA